MSSSDYNKFVLNFLTTTMNSMPKEDLIHHIERLQHVIRKKQHHREKRQHAK